MKKSTLVALVALLNGEPIAEPDTIKAEIEAELNRGKAKADANKAVYTAMHDPVMEAIRIAASPVTASDIAKETGFSRSKISYALSNYWADEVEADDSGKVKTYTLKV